MRKFPQLALMCFFALTGLHTIAQDNTIIKADNNGKLNYTYSKNSSNSFHINIVLKNDQSIYKQEIDSLQIESAAAFQLLKQDLQNAITALQNANSNFKIERSNYRISTNDTGVSGFFIVLSNKAGTIQTANTKFQIRLLLEWLNSIEFGKN